MKVFEIVFSPTGGTQRVANIIARELGGELVQIDLSDRNADFSTVLLGEDDITVIAMPSFAGLVPQIATERLSKIKGNNANAVLVCVYGNRAYEDTLVEMQDTAEKCGFKVVAALSAVAEHSIMHQYATGRPDAEDEVVLRGFANQILDKIHNGIKNEFIIPGNRPYKKSGGGGLVPEPTKACVNCGICAVSCPVGAIDTNDVTKTDLEKCIYCMRCVAKCPKSARRVNEAMVNVIAMKLKKVCSVKKENELFI